MAAELPREMVFIVNRLAHRQTQHLCHDLAAEGRARAAELLQAGVPMGQALATVQEELMPAVELETVMRRDRLAKRV